MTLQPVYLAVTFTLLSSPVMSATWQQHHDLHQRLFQASRYNKELRPFELESRSLKVYMKLFLLSLVDVQAKSQHLITNAQLALVWSDFLLSWNSSAYGGIKSMLVSQENLWLPDVVVGNSVTTQSRLGYDELPVRLLCDGSLKWIPTTLLVTSCEIEVTYYPFDTQLCYIDFETAMSDNSEVDIKVNPSDPISMEEYSVDGQWVLLETGAENLSDEQSVTKIRFKLLLQRRRTFYVVNIILPVLFLSITSSLVFALPADAGEKMTIGITVLLAYAVYLSIVAEHLPNTSVHTSLLALYLSILLGVTALSVITSVFILRMHHKPEDEFVEFRFKCLETLFLKRSRSVQSEEKEKMKRRNTVTPIEQTKPQNAKGVHSIIVKPVSVQEVELENKMTWREFAQATDWFCFVSYTCVTSVMTVAILLTLGVGSVVNSPTLD